MLVLVLALEEPLFEACATDDALDETLAELLGTGAMLCERPDGAGAASASEEEPPQEASTAMPIGTTRSVAARQEWRTRVPPFLVRGRPRKTEHGTCRVATRQRDPGDGHLVALQTTRESRGRGVFKHQCRSNTHERV